MTTAIAAAAAASLMKGALFPIAHAVDGSANFSNIPQTFSCLYLTGQIRGTNANTIEYGNITFNGDTSNVYSYAMISGDGASASSSNNTPTSGSFYLGLIPGGNATANVFGSYEIWIPNYTNSNFNKTVIWKLSADSNGTGVVQMGVGTYFRLNTITAVNVFGSNGSGIGTTHSLYGIRGVNQ